MPIRSDLWSEVQSALSGLATCNLSASSAGYDLYEAYIWAIALSAARNEGASVHFRDRTGATPTHFFFRTSPSQIYSTAQNYCHAELEFGPSIPTLEAHVGIYVQGRSHVEHECDVAVVPKNEAETCRQSNAAPRSSKLILAVECKYYLQSAIGVNLGRSYMGLVSEVYKGDRHFVGTVESSSVSKMLSTHNKRFELGLTPLNTRLETRLRGSFEKTFRNYKAQFL